ncbi:MAG: MarR family transcriptional regulator [Acidimicrobiales bacterium]
MTTSTPTKQTPADTIAAVLAAHPGASAAELAEAAGIGRSSASKALAAMEQQGTARRTPGGRDGGRRLADCWHPAADSADPPPAEADPKVRAEVSDGVPAASGEGEPGEAAPAETEAGRLGKGALRSLVMDYLADHAGPDGLGPTAVAKGLGGRSSGAVGNALQRLEGEGRARLVSQLPRRYITVG